MLCTAFTIITSLKRRDFTSVQRVFTMDVLLPQAIVDDCLYDEGGTYTVINDIVGELLQACAPTLLRGKVEVSKDADATEGLQPVMPIDMTLDLALMHKRYHQEGQPIQMERLFSLSADLYTSNGKVFASYVYEAIADSVGKRFGLCDLDLSERESRCIVEANNYIFDGVAVYDRQTWASKGDRHHMPREKANIVAALCSGVATQTDAVNTSVAEV